MASNERDPGQSVRRDPTLADVVARRLAQLGLMWATRWILAGLVLVFALGLLAAWGILLVAITWIGGLLGLTTGGRATPFVITALVASGLMLLTPTRWAARNLLRTERALDATIERVGPATPIGPSTTVATRNATTPDELRAIDARLAGTPAASAPWESTPEED